MKKSIFLFFLLLVLSCSSIGQELDNTEQQKIIDAINNKTVLNIPETEREEKKDGQQWNTTQKTLEGLNLALLSVDYIQSRNMQKCFVAFVADSRYDTINKTKECIVYNEANKILGRHPSEKKIKLYFSTVIISQYFIADSLPSKYRTMFLSGLLSVEGLAVGHNKMIGVSGKF